MMPSTISVYARAARALTLDSSLLSEHFAQSVVAWCCGPASGSILLCGLLSDINNYEDTP